MAQKVMVNLATGLEDPERVTIAFLVGTAALAKGNPVAMFLTKDAVRLALPGHAAGVACDGCPPLERLFEQYQEGGGELLDVPDLLQGASARRGRFGRERQAGRRHADARVDRGRGRDRLQLLITVLGSPRRWSRCHRTRLALGKTDDGTTSGAGKCSRRRRAP